RCGTMRVLDMTQPVDLERIYTDVNIIKDVIGRRRIGYEDVMEVCTREHFDRFLVGTIQERVTGFAAVEEFQKLVVLGKPGAGKTTFMKYLAMSCLAGKFHGELVPIFVTLKVYAETKGKPTLQEYIFAEFRDRDVSEETVKRLLKEGKALILLDGLDEVKKEHDRRVKQDIDKFSRDWLKNRFAITCRIAAREYQFEKFTEVEVADFGNGQIKTFVNNWFKGKDEPKAARLLEKLKDNEPVQELAKSPLLLTLLCLVFGERNDLPPKRSELYKEGLEVLMKKWDAKRNIEREQIYKHLSPQNKEDMLGQIAFNTFVNGEYFFRQEDLQHQIKYYICNLPEADGDPEVLRVDSEVVLKAIEHHHGLLVERARNIYSFSHLTFQEYFTAREIERERKLEDLMQHITDPRWEEVFLLTAEMLRRSDNFLLMMKEAIDLILAGDKRLQAFLLWVEQKVNSLRTDYKYRDLDIDMYRCSALRSFYFCSFSNIDYYFESNLTYTLDYQFARDLDIADSYNLYLNIAANFDLNLEIYIILKRTLAFKLESKLRNILSCENIRDIHLSLSQSLEYVSRISDNILQQELQKLKDSLPNPNSDYEIYFQWWKNNGEEWKNKLRQVCIKYCNIGHDWQFTELHLTPLEKYYAANHLLVQCMNRSYVSKQVREEIEATLLLPREK
ncbi:MAG: NACHT domain-containing NTPase, partial [Coleofasciculaceae cyanobacterium SM2_1_6]|nr:NACHT domain-containing NTPase [Coleofasciculaceae cyanobacterium SM2_1_6]